MVFPVGTEVEIQQAEMGDAGGDLIGFIAGGDEGSCMLHEIELIDRSNHNKRSMNGFQL